MEYSALVFDDCKEVEDTYDKLLETIDLFANDENCTQIVVSCKSVWTLRLASSPKNKVMLVQRPDKPYVALLNGLKAVTRKCCCDWYFYKTYKRKRRYIIRSFIKISGY